MSAIVPTVAGYPAEFFVRGGMSIKSLTMQDVAKLLHWSIGRGGQLIPCYSPNYAIPALRTARFKFRVQPRYQAYSRIWTIGTRTISASGSLEYKVATPSGGTQKTYNALSGYTANNPILHYHDLSAQSSAETEISIDIENANASGTITVESIGCFDVPRLDLALAAYDYGVDVETLGHRQPIFYDDDGKGISSLATTSAEAFGLAHRTGMFHHAWPIVGDAGVYGISAAKTVTATAYDPVFKSAAGATRAAPQLARKERRDGAAGYTLKTINVGVLGAVTGGSGDVRFTMTNGATVTLNVTATATAFGGTSAGTWVTSTINVTTEDASTANGLRAAAWDLATIEARKNTSGTLYIAGVSMWGG